MFSCFIALIANGNTSIVGVSPGLRYALTYPYTLGGKWIITSVWHDHIWSILASLQKARAMRFPVE